MERSEVKDAAAVGLDGGNIGESRPGVFVVAASEKKICQKTLRTVLKGKHSVRFMFFRRRWARL